ncbi:MAG: SRPBCC domain-containing protein [Patescibacteria group bacterium]|nr:SRPBCC domain-containing protein [Patescibacteria group bacterium]
MDTKDIVITRMFDAPVGKVWETWTTVEGIQKWWGPKNFTAPVIKIDFKIGGQYLYCMHGSAGPNMPAQDYWSGGSFLEIVPMKKIVAMDHFTDKDGNIISPNAVGMPGTWPEEMKVTFEFEEIDGKTKLTLTHEGHPKEMAEMATMGWNQSLDKLAESL